MICSTTMARRTAAQAAVAALLLTALAACNTSSSGDRGTATAQTVATEPPTTTTTNPYAVPAVIDAAYVNRVLAGLDAQMGEVVRTIIQTKTIPRDAYDRLRAVYGSDQWLQSSIDSFQADIRKNFSSYRANPGNKTTTVATILSSNMQCIFAQVVRDYSAVSSTASAPEMQWVALKPVSRVNDPNGYNPTNWALIYDGYAAGRVAPNDPCAK